MIAALRARLAGHDAGLLAVAASLAIAGLILALAASPSAAARMGFDSPFHFAWRQAAFAIVGLFVFAACAALSPVGVRRAGVALFAAAIVLGVATLFIGVEVKGARRWIRVAGLSIQAAEILKPGFVVAAAWLLSEQMGRPRFPGVAAALGLFAVSAALLLAQPDVGQTALLGLAFVTLALLARAPLVWTAALALGGALAAGGAYLAFDHVRARVAAFFGDESYQVARALDAIGSGGAFGRGPGEGVVKDSLPDAHSDFIYAVAAEEFGLLASLGVLALFAALVGGGLARAARLVDPFAQLAAAGLFALLGAQAAVHVAVNLAALPAKGMTLPLVSYGGSSMIGAAVALGFAFALSRARAGAFLYGETPSFGRRS